MKLFIWKPVYADYNMIHLVYQSYGKEWILNETTFSILSFLYFAEKISDWHIVVYTDCPDHFQGLPVTCEQLNSEQLNEWSGKHNFIHRIKVKILQDFFRKYEGNLLYLDSDTVFMQNPGQIIDMISPEQSIMHICEGKISERSNPVFKKMDRFLRKNVFTNTIGKALKISPDAHMWNAGVIGLCPEHQHLLADVLHLTDAFYARYKKHYMEQFAFSYILSHNTEILPSYQCVFHYWYDKDRMEGPIREFLNQDTRGSVQSLVQKVPDVAQKHLRDKAEQILKKTEKKGFLNRIFYRSKKL